VCCVCVRARLDDDRRCRTQVRNWWLKVSGRDCSSCSRCSRVAGTSSTIIDGVGICQCCSPSMLYNNIITTYDTLYTTTQKSGIPRVPQRVFSGDWASDIRRLSFWIVVVVVDIEQKYNKNTNNDHLIFLQIDVVALACVRAHRSDRPAMRRPSST